MSYDGWVEWRGREVRDIGNMTSNVAPMWFEALGFPLSATSGWPVRLAEFVFQHCADVMRADPSKFIPMEPANGWGNFEGAVEYVQNAADACRPYRDDAVVRWFV